MEAVSPMEPSLATRAHEALLRAQLQVWAAVVAALLVLVGVAGATEYSQHREQRQAAIYAHNRTEFWKVIAGVGQSGRNSADITLAEDLRKALGPVGSNAPLPAAIRDFQGDANLYGGVTSDLGFNPFAGNQCRECGSLTPSVQSKLLQIKHGGVERIVAAEAVSQPGRYVFTPFGLSALEAAGLLWLAGGGVVFLVGRRRVFRQYVYSRTRFAELSWTLDGTCNGTKCATILLAPSYFGPHLAALWFRQRKLDQQARRVFGDEMALIHQVDAALRELPPSDEASALRQRRDDMLEGIYAQMKAEHRTDGLPSSKSLDVAGLQAQLDMAEQVLQFRRKLTS
ncbi:MAG: hypothetical protein JWN01_708 [Patescibacteria group bacterium]|nr:hypothetical protein [Patescibacteria group bacterium]